VERPHLVERLDAAAAAGRLIVFDARPGFGSRTAIRAWVARHPDWQVVWDDSRVPPDGPDEVLRRGLSVLTHLPEVTDSGGRTVLVIEDARRFVDRIELLDLTRLAGRRRDVTVVVCTAGRLARRPAQRDVEVVTDGDLAWDADLASEALARRGLAVNEEQLARLVHLCGGSPGRIVACAQLRTEYPGASAERMYTRWLHERLGRNGADRLLLGLDVLGEVPVELVPALLEATGSSEEALAELRAEGLVERTASHFHDAVVLTVVAPRAVLAILRTLVPARGEGVPVAEIARELASRAAPGSLQGRYWAALAGDTDAAHAFIEAVLAHPDPRAVEFVVDTRWLVMTRAAEDPAFVAACLLVECGRGGDPRDLPDAENLLRLSDDEFAAQTEGARGAILACRAILLIADARPAEAVRAAEAALAQLERAPWAERQRAARIRNAVLVTLLAALTELLDLDAADRHARVVLAAPEGDRWRISLEAAAGLALFNATLRGDLAMAELCEPFTRVREAEGARPAHTVLLARYVDAMNARDLPQMAAVAKQLRHGERSSRAWDLLGSFAVKDLAFRDRAPDSLAEPARDRHDLAPLPRAVALDLRARQLIEMGRPGLALRLLEGLEPDARHVFCFVALRARALLAMGFPEDALRELEACEKVADHSRRTSWRVRIVRIVALARSGMPSVARTAFDTLVVDVPPRWWGGVINWARFPELRAHAERLGVPGPQGTEADDVLREPLTRREAELLTLLRGDASVQQLAAEQFVSLNTIKTHLRNLYRKLGAASRPDAVDRAMRAGLFDAFRFLEE
jgi:DNA-binding CsgD family transcriptional regulator